MVRHRLTEFRHAAHRRVLVAAIQQGRGGGMDHISRPIIIGETLPQIDRAMLIGERRHDGEDRGADAGEEFVLRLHLPCPNAKDAMAGPRQP